MILFPNTYTQHVGEHLVTAYPPEGGGRFRYLERLRPAQDFGTLIEKTLQEDSAFRASSIGKTTKIVTLEGEYGAWVPVFGTREQSQARHYIGAVFTEEFVAVLDTLAVVPARFQQFARLSEDYLRSVRLDLGTRPRFFYYTPPPGWQALQSGLVANWYPLEYPNNRTNISVSPARPTALSQEELMQAQLTEAGAAGLPTIESIASKSGYEGQLLRVGYRRNPQSPLIHREVAVFLLHGYAYFFRMECMSEAELGAMQAIFRGVIDSFEPLPQANERRLGHAMVSLSKEAVLIWEE